MDLDAALGLLGFVPWHNFDYRQSGIRYGSPAQPSCRAG
jgi:hypothetical protein